TTTSAKCFPPASSPACSTSPRPHCSRSRPTSRRRCARRRRSSSDPVNFFEHQAAARRASTRLVVLFALAVVGIVAAVDLVVWVVYGSMPPAPDGGGGSTMGAMVVASLATVAVIGLGSLFRIASLRGGGDQVALQLGGTPVPEDTTDFNLRRLRNVVEEIAIASGVPVPRIYVLEHE